MRLYLSSYRLGEYGDCLRAMVRGAGRGHVIMNALDGGDEARRQEDAQRQIRSLAEIGLEATVLDLREHTPLSIDEAVGRRTSCGCAAGTCSPCAWRSRARGWTR